MKLGIIPNSMDFSHPQDRRRYVKYIVEKGVNFEIAHFGSFYDVLYISLNCDINLWSQNFSIENFKKKFSNFIDKSLSEFK